MRIASRERITRVLSEKGIYTKTFNGTQLVITKVQGEFWIKVIEKGERPRLWIYRREHIALNRFEEQAESLRR